MELIKTSEKIIIWMHRNEITAKQIADEANTTRQNVSQMIKTNVISSKVLMAIKRLGYEE